VSATIELTAPRRRAYVDGYTGGGAKPDEADLALMWDQGKADAAAGTAPVVPIPTGDTGAKKPAGKKAPAKKAPAKKSSSSKRRVARARRTGRKARGLVGVPVPSKVAGRSSLSAGQLFGLGVGLALLYNAVTHADAVAFLLDAPRKALEWLSDPSKSIPYKEH